MNFIEDIKYKTICYYGQWSFKNLVKVLRTDGTSAMLLYRLSQFFIKYKLGIIAIPIRYMNRLINSFWIGRNAAFGKGFVIMHPYGIVINSNIKGGDNIILQSGVIIGVANDNDPDKIPILGNNIYIGAGAKLLGRIKIGNNVTIGANSVIIADIPDNSTAVGVPGKVLVRDRMTKSQSLN